MEIELKFLIDEPIARERILKDKYINEIKEAGSYEEIQMDATYLDTKELDMHKAKMAYRIRYENGKPIATLKWNGKVEDGLHIRGELNVPVDNEYIENPTMEIFKGSEIYGRIVEVVGENKLYPVMEMKCLRKQVMVDTGRSISVISMDEGQIITSKGNAPISELEVELYSGDKDDMIALGKKLAEKYNLKPGLKSKFQVGMELLGQ